ncbi:hypothetical protein [Nocardia sp. NPDC059236]|uniref:hypothetical protein n=1 Tax=Nocardia sp. NPDC059236 TaxID=3346783 RepID=UPI0036CB69E8
MSTHTPWYLAYEAGVEAHGRLHQPLTALPLPEPLEPEEFALVADILDTSAAMAGQILVPRVIRNITGAVLQLLGIKSSPSPVSGSGSPAAGDDCPAATALSNP